MRLQETSQQQSAPHDKAHWHQHACMLPAPSACQLVHTTRCLATAASPHSFTRCNSQAASRQPPTGLVARLQRLVGGKAKGWAGHKETAAAGDGSSADEASQLSFTTLGYLHSGGWRQHTESQFSA